MLRRTLLVVLTVLAVTVGRAEAVTLRDIIELSKAGLSDPVLLALIEVDRGVFSIDTETLKVLKDAGVSETVIVALIRSGRTPRAVEPVPEPRLTDPDPDPAPREPQVIVIDHRDSPAPAAAQYPAMPSFYVPGQTFTTFGGFGTFGTFNNFNRVNNLNRHNSVVTTVNTDVGLVRARLPVPAGCVAAQPVFWGFGGKLRPGSYAPPPTVLCR
jgi:hypothetical protein